jgi:hypothetical protein
VPCLKLGSRRETWYRCETRTSRMRHRTVVQSVVFEVLSYGTEQLYVQQVTTVGVCVIIWLWADYTTPFVLQQCNCLVQQITPSGYAA